MTFLRTHQLDIMLFESGMCAMLALLAFVIQTKSKKRRVILASLAIGSVILLISDRFAYLYRGNTTEKGYWMVRISNFLVFFFTICLVHFFTLYLVDLYQNEEKLQHIPKALIAAETLFYIGAALLIISQFTGLYYTFDENNVYHRSSTFLLCYIFPLLIPILQLTVIVRHHKNISNIMYIWLILFPVLPVAASILQVFAYGISLTNIVTACMTMIIFIFAFLDLNARARKASKMEIRFLKDEQTKIRNMFGQTTEALADAIDAKDVYTRGHSTRVADYARMIAEKADLSENEVDQVYFAALLHDVGKIGIPDEIINKPGRLTSEEYMIIKRHPVIGSHILSAITESPYLSIGAHYHHERYDGHGYPDGLVGEEIPVIARIIAVADSYDAMTSTRSYRVPFDQKRVREELVKETGRQFDPKFAEIMINLIDRDSDFSLRERM